LQKQKVIFSLKSRKAVNNPDIFKIQSIVRQVHSYPLKNSKSVYNFQVSKKTEKTAVLIVTPETGRLPDEMGTLARYISCKSGGLGEVVSALCEGLRERKLIATRYIDLKKAVSERKQCR